VGFVREQVDELLGRAYLGQRSPSKYRSL